MSEKLTFTIQSIRPPGEGQRSAMITTTENKRLWLWADKLGLVKVGATYEAIIETNDRGFTNIKTVKQMAGPVVALVPQAAPRQQATATAGAAFSTPEQIFCRDLIVAYIASGRCPPEGLTKTITYIRKAWSETFGGNDAYPYDQAAE